MEHENRYLVLKRSDLEKYLPDVEHNQLIELAEMVRQRRIADGKRDDSFVCVADDWPMYESVWGMIEAWVDSGEYPSPDCSIDTDEFVSNVEITAALETWGWNCNAEAGRLMLAELLLKAGAGCKSSHTEEGFASEFRLLNKDRTPNKRGRQFLCSMLYKHSNNRPEYYRLMDKYRQ